MQEIHPGSGQSQAVDRVMRLFHVGHHDYKLCLSLSPPVSLSLPLSLLLSVSGCNGSLVLRTLIVCQFKVVLFCFDAVSPCVSLCELQRASAVAVTGVRCGCSVSRAAVGARVSVSV